MGAWKTCGRTALICLALVGGPRLALAQPLDPHLRGFAICAGRLSALVEHQWLVDGPASESTARSRDAMVSLVEAVLSPEAAPAALHLRIEAKVAHGALLSRAAFAGDAVAARRSDRLIEECLALLGQS